MSLVINTNTQSLQALHYLNRTNKSLGQAFEKISSGSRVNRAADDAAGLSVADNFKAPARESIRNTNDGISVAASPSGTTTNTDLLLGPSIADRMSKLVAQPQLVSIPLGDGDRAPRLEAEENLPTKYEGAWPSISLELTTDLASRAVDSVRAGLIQDPTAALQAQARQSADRAVFLLR